VTDRHTHAEKQTPHIAKYLGDGLFPGARARNFQGRFLRSREPFHVRGCFGSEFVEPIFFNDSRIVLALNVATLLLVVIKKCAYLFHS